MFRSKRSALVKRLWRGRILQNEAASPPESAEELELKSVAQSMLKRLKEKQLEVLVQSVESKGGETTECVLLPRGDLRLGRKALPPHVLCCQLWRWPEIAQGADMKRLSCCTTVDDPAYICCNPYHWSLLLKTDLSTAGIARSSLERIKRTDRPITDPVSTETGLTPTPYRQNPSDTVNGYQNHWCSVAYWELRDRVGRLFTVFQQSINIFQVLPHGDGMCLGILQQDTDLESVRRTRDKIGFGLTLSKEDNGVWAYNRSSYPIFVNSPTLEVPNSRILVVRKILPGYSIKIFDYECSELYEAIRDPQFLDGPFDPSSVRISFAKGWGPYYSRQFITSCPCWIEILLNINR